MADKLYDFLFSPDLEAQSIESVTIPDIPQRDELSDFLGIQPMSPDEIKAHAQPSEPVQPIVQDQVSDPEPIQTEQPQFAEEIGAKPTVQTEPRQQPQDFSSRQEFLKKAVVGDEAVSPVQEPKRIGLGEAMIRSAGAGAGELGISIAKLPQTAAEIYIGLNNLFNKGINKGVEVVSFGKIKDAIPMVSHDVVPDIIKLKEEAWDTKAVRKFINNQKEAVKLATNEKGIVDNLLAGDFGEAGKSLGVQAAAQVPLVASMFVGGLAGMGAKALGNVAGATAASQQMDQYWQEVEKGVAKQTPDIAAANALVNGFIEKFGETLGTGKIVSEAIDLLGKAGKKEVAKKTIGKTVGNYVGKVMQSAGTEFSEEAIVGFSQTVSDKIFGAKPDATFLDAVKEGIEGGLTGFATSFGTSGQLAGIAEIAEDIVPRKDVQPEAQIEPSEAVQEKPIEKVPDVTEEVLSDPIKTTIEESEVARKEHELSIKKELKSLKKNVESGIDLEINQLKAIKEDFETTGFPKTKRMFKEYWEGLTGEVLTNEESRTKLNQVIGSTSDSQTEAQKQVSKDSLPKKKIFPEKKKPIEKKVSVKEPVTEKKEEILLQEKPVEEKQKTIPETIKTIENDIKSSNIFTDDHIVSVKHWESGDKSRIYVKFNLQKDRHHRSETSGYIDLDTGKFFDETEDFYKGTEEHDIIKNIKGIKIPKKTETITQEKPVSSIKAIADAEKDIIEQFAPIEAEAKKHKSAKEFEKNINEIARGFESGLTGLRARALNLTKNQRVTERIKDVKKHVKDIVDSGESTVTIYRAAKGPIREGDFVTLEKSIAEDYIDEEDSPTLYEKEVPLKDVVLGFGGNVREFVYAPKRLETTAEKLWYKANRKEEKETKIAKVEGQEVDIAPTEAQKEAGNYKKAHITRDGMEISIENPAGSVRTGTDKDGETWSQEMKLDYGYIKGTKGFDKDHVDVFVKPGAKEGGKVFVVNQVDPKTKKFDEHKAIIGVETEKQALGAYNSNYEKGWKGAGDIVEMTMDEFKAWARSDAPSKGEAKALKVPVEEKPVSKKAIFIEEKPKAILTATIKINDGTKEIEIDRGTKVKYGKKEGTVVGYRNIKDKYFSRFKDDKTGKVELVPLSKPLKPIEKIGEKETTVTVYKGLPKKDYRTGEDIVKIDATKIGKKAAGYFSTKKEVAQRFADTLTKKGFSKVVKANVSFKNPYIIDAKGKYAKNFMTDALDPKDNNKELVKALESDKYDGLIIKNTSDEGDIVVPKGGEQISIEEAKPSDAIPEKQVDGITETDIKEIGTKPNNLEAIPEKKKEEITKKPRIKPSEGLPASPSDEKGKTSEQLRTSDVIATARKTRAKTATTKSNQIKAMSDIAKQVQHNPGGPKKGSGWLNPWETAYFKAKEIAWPILKMRKVLTEAGVKKESLLESFDYAIDEVRGAADAAQQYIEDNYDPIFEPLKKMKSKESGQVARDLSRYLVAKRTEWLYNNKKGYEDAGISLKNAETVIDYMENGDNPNGGMITDMSQQIWAYNKGLIKIKHKAGVIDDQLLENLKEPYYVPHYRDVDTGIHKPSAPMKLMFTATSTGIKRITKSGHMIIDPLQLMVSSTHETIVNASRVKVAQNIIKVAEAHPEVFSGLVSKLPPKWLKAGSIEHRMQVDKLLRDDIDAFAKDININVKVAAKLGRKRLGHFDSFNQEIKVLYGATESARAHELGHALDEKFPWLNKLLSQKKFNKEMELIADSRYEGQEVPTKFVRYVRQSDEKIAEFVSLYLTNRPMLMNIAPNAFGAFENKIKSEPKLKALIGMKPSNVRVVESFNENNYVLDNSIPADEDVISLRQDGKLVHYRVPIEMAQAVKNLHSKQLPSFLKWTIGLQTRMLRAGAVGLNIGFVIPNLIRDAVGAAFNVKTMPGVDFYKGAVSYIKQDEIAKMWKRRGGGMGSPESGIGGAKKGYADIIYKKKFGVLPGQFLDPFYWKNRGVLKATGDLSLFAIKFPFKPILSLVEISEAGTRVGIFRRSLLSSGVDLNNLQAKDAQFAIGEAVHAARHSTIDFNRFGYSGKIPNEIIPFVNASLEGVDRFARSWVVPIQEGKVPVRPIMFTALTYGIYAGLTAWNREKEGYKEISSREKANNWIIMLDDDNYIKIPKDHITQMILNPFQMIFEASLGLSQKTGWGLAVDLFTDISPIDPGGIAPVTLKLILEPIANYDFYWNDTIEKQTHKAAIPGHRFKASTSETLKTIGEALNISPIMMQHEIRSAFGGLGRDILWLTDWVLGTTGVQKPPGLELENAIVIKRFVGKTEEWMSDSAERIRKINKRITEIKRAGKGARVKRLRSMKYTPEEIRKVILASRKEMSQLHIRKRKLEIAQRKTRLLKSQANKTGTKFK